MSRKKPEKVNIEKIRKIAAEKNSVCLSDYVFNNRTKITIKCSKGHLFEFDWDRIMKGSWCPECTWDGRRNDGIKLATKIAESKNGKCLSTEYKNNKDKLLWECSFGHKWEAIFLNVYFKGKWCPVCSKNKKLTIEKMHDLAREKNGKCLSDKYVNSQTKLKRECNAGHVWSSIPNNIVRGSWCPICAGSYGERVCHMAFEYIFKKQFEKKRFDWLKNDNDNNLELDGYCAELNIAFEYNGAQHYNKMFYDHSFEYLLKIQKHDKIKKQKCKELGITLFIFKERNGFNFDILINEIMKELNVKINKHEINNIKSMLYSFNKLDKYKQIAIEKGGVCLSEFYLTSNEKLKWRCNDGHEWFALPYSVEKKSWCPFCSGKIITIKKCQDAAQKMDGICLSKKYIDYKTKLQWKCFYGHVFERLYSDVKAGRWCRECKKLKKI